MYAKHTRTHIHIHTILTFKMACAGCAQAAMKADQDWAVPPCVLLWLRLLGSSGHRSEKDVCDLLQNAKNALSARIHTPRERELVGAIEWLSNGDLGETRHAVERCLLHAPVHLDQP